MLNLEKLNEMKVLEVLNQQLHTCGRCFKIEWMDDLESEETTVEIETKGGQTKTGTTTVHRIEMTGEEGIGTGEIGIMTDGDRSRITTTTDEDGKCLFTWEQTRGKPVEGIK